MNLSRISTGFAIVGKFGMAGVFSIIFVYSSELYPTVIRYVFRRKVWYGWSVQYNICLQLRVVPYCYKVCI